MSISCIFEPVSKPADSCLSSLPSILASNPPFPCLSLSIPSKPRPVKLHLTLTLSLKPPRTVLFSSSVAQVSDWAQQEGENDAAVIVAESQQEEGEELETQAVSDLESEGEAAIDDGEDEPLEDAKIFVGNLPYDVDSEKLAMLLEQAGTVMISEVIYNRETDTSRGFGFVSMSTVEEAEKAVEMFHRFDLDGRLLTVNKAAPRGSKQEHPPRIYEPGYRIYVGKLPWVVDNARLEKVFSEHGKVIDAQVVYDRETGRSRGFGFVTMSTETEMNDAIAALDGRSLDGRSIRVNVAKQRPSRTI